MKLGGPHSWSAHIGWRKNPLPLPGIETPVTWSSHSVVRHCTYWATPTNFIMESNIRSGVHMMSIHFLWQTLIVYYTRKQLVFKTLQKVTVHWLSSHKRSQTKNYSHKIIHTSIIHHKKITLNWKSYVLEHSEKQDSCDLGRWMEHLMLYEPGSLHERRQHRTLCKYCKHSHKKHLYNFTLLHSPMQIRRNTFLIINSYKVTNGSVPTECHTLL
jgi:hypothetical protein